MAKLQQNSREIQRWLIKRKKKGTSGLGRKWKETSSGQGGPLRALSVAHSSVLGAEAPCELARSGEGPVEKCLGYPRAGLQAVQGALERRWWARSRPAGPPQRPGPGAALVAAEAEDPGHRCGGVGSRQEAALGRRAALPALGPLLVAAPASAADACRRGSVWGGGECKYV